MSEHISKEPVKSGYQLRNVKGAVSLYFASVLAS